MARIPQSARRGRALPVLAAVLLALGLGRALAHAAGSGEAGAVIPWHTYEAEAMETTGAVLGPSREPFRVETESSGLRCVRLSQGGAHVQFVAAAPANTLIVRYSLPDAT